MNKTLFAVLLIVALASICSATSETIYVNGINGTENPPTISPGSPITFTWDNPIGCPDYVPNNLMVWINGSDEHSYMYHQKPTPITSPFIIENGYPEIGDYRIGTPSEDNNGTGCESTNLVGLFTIGEPEEPNCHGCHGYEPYYGPVFVTHTAVVSVTQEAD